SFPRSAAIVTFVHAVTVGDGSLRIALAGPDPDDVGMLRVDGDPADRVGALFVEDRLPRRAAIGRLPDAAGCRADEDHGAVGRVDGDGHDAAGGDGGTDGSRFQTGERIAGRRRILVLRSTADRTALGRLR